MGTTEFANAVIDRLGMRPSVLKPVDYPVQSDRIKVTLTDKPKAKKDLVGIDIFLDWNGNANDLGNRLEMIANSKLKLVMITNRGTKVYPEAIPETFCVDHWRCRFQAANQDVVIEYTDLIDLLSKLVNSGFPPIKTEGLFTFDGKPGYSLGQGQ